MNTLERIFPIAFVLFMSSCATESMVYVESTNKNSRIDYLVIHATSENFAESLRLLTTRSSNPVSSHYLLPAPNDPSYPGNQLRVYSLVDEQLRAWHAGVSYWAGEESLNDRSIGIEVVNEFKCTGTERPLSAIDLDEVVCEFPPYPEQQIQMLIELTQSILARYPGINPIDIVGHSDIAIMRKSDPGPRFPWQQLYEAGIGAWPDDETVGGRQSGQHRAVLHRKGHRDWLAVTIALKGAAQVILAAIIRLQCDAEPHGDLRQSGVAGPQHCQDGRAQE